MIRIFDILLDKVSMHQAVLYALGVLAGYAITLSAFGIHSFSISALLLSLALLLGVSILTHLSCARLLGVKSNLTSTLITAGILFFIVFPPSTLFDGASVALIALFAIASKYLIVWRGVHILNPAAFGLVVAGVLGSGDSIWWVGSWFMLPGIVVVSCLLLWKLLRFSMVAVFLAVAGLLIAGEFLLTGKISEFFSFFILSSPHLFMAVFMLTEPQTIPRRNIPRLIFGGGVGLLCGVFYLMPNAWSLGPLFPTPELALLIGNILAFVYAPRQRYIATLQSKEEIARDTYEVTFALSRPLPSISGQYVECVLPHKADARGERRYFTLASPANASEVSFGIRVAPQGGSSFKRELLNLSSGGVVTLSSSAGDFVLPEDRSQSLLWIAGGIGITPFASMARDMLSRGDIRDVVLVYFNNTLDDVAYQELFFDATRVGVVTQYMLREGEGWENVHVGVLSKEILLELVPDIQTRLCYLSGPHGMVKAGRMALRGAGVRRTRIREDFFPGYSG